MQITNRTVAGTRVALAAAMAITLLPGTGLAHEPEARVDDAAAAAGASECSNHSLRGDYAFTIDGTILAGPTPGLLRGVAMTHFDGEGNLTQVDFATINGIPGSPDWRPATGTYEVNADCTGRAEIVPVVGPPLQLRMVVFDGGRQVAAVVVGNATGGLGTRR